MPNFAQNDTPTDTVVGSRQSNAADTAFDNSLSDRRPPDNRQQTSSGQLSAEIAKLIHRFPDYPEEIKKAFAKATNPHSGWSGLRVFFTILLTSVFGLLSEQFTIRKLLNRLYAYVDTQQKSTALKFKFILTRVIIQLVGVAVLGLVVYCGALYFRHGNPFFQLLFTATLAALVKLRILMILLRNIFSPTQPSLRPIALDDASARNLFVWFVGFFIILEFAWVLPEYTSLAGLDDALSKGMAIPITLSLNLIILSRIWAMRKKITAMFINDIETNQEPSIARDFLATSWPFLFTVWMVFLWMLWLYNWFLGQTQIAGYITASWLFTLALFVADRVFYSLIKNVINITWLHSPTFKVRSRRFIRIVQNGFRVLMLSIPVYTLSLARGLNPDVLIAGNFGNQALEQGINLVVIATITYIIWEFFNALIERSLPEEIGTIATLEGEGGGAGATRAETLLPLMRTCLTVVLVTFVMLSVLNSLGIAITPLLAGAGVVGIAIGFGAQKLVQDILSGIFFLIDDAFRKNEYIEMENLRGTVEKISLRSMQLRHHLGAMQTIPYGEIKTVKNLSRDWITMKLELRLPYDTDIEQVRKVIKKVGQDMLQDEVMGPNFILPLKSQGVMRVEESALIMRMKFTAIPGEQWVIRREAYRHVRDALSAAGIFFAHREVRVRLADESPTKTAESATKTDEVTIPEQKQALANAGSAASDAIISDQAKRNQKIDWDNEM